MPPPRSVVLVEGVSDRIALTTLATRISRDLAAAGVEIVAMNGITNIRSHAARHGPQGFDRQVVGLYDAPEESYVVRGLAATGFGPDLTSADLPDLGFFRCEADLEDELINALGEDDVVALIEDAGEGRSLRLLAQMPAQRGWSRREILRRFLTSQGGRKARYAARMVEALDEDRVPAPLRAVLDAAGQGIPRAG